MKKLLPVLVLLAISIFIVWRFVLKKEKEPSGGRQQPIAVSKHSAAFNETMQHMMNAYYALTEAFVNWDTAAVSKSSAELKTALDNLKLEEMKKDSAIYPTVESQWGMVKTEIAGLIGDEGLTAKRESLNMLSQQIFDLLRIIKYDVAKVYYQECPMALNNYETSAFWLSNDGSDNKRRNPYLGLHDPKYGRGMLICGETRDSVNFVSADSTGR
jgi:hypothetical protein